MISYGQLTEQVASSVLYQSSYGLRFGIFTEWKGKYIFSEASRSARFCLLRHFVTQQKGPILPANHAIHLFGSITDGIKSAYNGSHTGPYHVIYRIPASSITFKAPICAIPLAPPTLRTTPTFFGPLLAAVERR